MNATPKYKPKLGPPPRDARQQVLAAWRGLDLTPVERAHTLSTQSAGQVLPRVLQELKLDKRRSDAEILKAWNQLQDPNVVAHAHPVHLHKGTLFVTVDSSSWHCEIVRYRRKEILERLQHCFGKDLIVRLSFRVG